MSSFTSFWKKYIIYGMFFVCQFAIADDPFSIVFIHVGKTIPTYAETALIQARKFNPDCPIVMIADQEAIEKFSQFDGDESITYISCESLKKTKEHKQFIKDSTLNDRWREGFWRYSSERFLYLQDYMVQYKQKNIFHLEYDNMLYVDLSDHLPTFISQYNGIAATFDNEKRCIAGFIYIPNSRVMTSLARFFAVHAKKGYNDMQTLSLFKQAYGKESIDYLPIITKEYIKKYPLRSTHRHKTKHPEHFVRHIDLFESIFDAAALGQYLGGIDPLHGKDTVGFINERCLFQPNKLTIQWEADKQGRKIPYVIHSENKYRINNLHIHSKELEKFKS